MSKYPFMQVDAFTDHPLGGNPCAILFETDGFKDETMLAIAREMNLSETSFVYRSKRADYGARYFTPGGEIPLAGHPTIATTHALVESGRLVLTGELTEIILELQAGLIPVEISSKAGKILRITMTQNKPLFMATYSSREVLPIFGLASEDLLPNSIIQTVSTGTPQLMVSVRDLETLKRIQIDMTKISALHAQGDFFSAHLFCLGGATSAGDTFARHFAPPPDIFEDPFTGSATGGMAAYLWHYGLIDHPAFIAEQGHWLSRPGQATVELIGPRNDIQAVKVGGQAVTILHGEFIL
ncbi:PhzF family phenazine biosynthesis protein [Chloroflexota bacterium]